MPDAQNLPLVPLSCPDPPRGVGRGSRMVGSESDQILAKHRSSVNQLAVLRRSVGRPQAPPRDRLGRPHGSMDMCTTC
jgi:hypothetical protein